MRQRFVVGPIVFVALAGCQPDAPLAPANRSSGIASLTAPNVSSSGVRKSSDDEFDDLVGDIPGFGGLFYDSTGTLTVYLKDPGTVDVSRAKIRAHLSKDAGNHFARLSQVSDHVARMRVRRANYDFRELRGWYRRHVIAMLGARGVTMTDIDEQRNRIVVGVRDDSFIAALRARIGATGIPPDAIEIVKVPAVALGGPTTVQDCDPTISIIECPPDPGGGFGASYTLRQTARPVVGGMQISYFNAPATYLCSLAFNVARRVGGILDSDRFFVTAGHCTDQVGYVTQMTMGQSTVSETIAQEFADPSFFNNSGDGACPVGRSCRRSDVAMFKYASSGSQAGPTVAFPALGSLFVTDIRQVASVGDPLVGQSVHLVGRTSGHTTGSVLATCVNHNVGDDMGFDTGRTMLCQTEANYTAGPGDSGAPVVAVASDGSLVAVGVHWGKQASTGRAALSPISSVISELNTATSGTLFSSVIFINP